MSRDDAPPSITVNAMKDQGTRIWLEWRWSPRTANEQATTSCHQSGEMAHVLVGSCDQPRIHALDLLVV